MQNGETGTSREGNTASNRNMRAMTATTGTVATNRSMMGTTGTTPLVAKAATNHVLPPRIGSVVVTDGVKVVSLLVALDAGLIRNGMAISHDMVEAPDSPVATGFPTALVGMV